MITLTYNGTFDEPRLIGEILTAYPQWRIVTPTRTTILVASDYDGTRLTLWVPDDADPLRIGQLVAAHDPLAYPPLSFAEVQANRQAFRALPEWATWTAAEAESNITARVWAGQTKAQVNAWIDANVTATNVTGLKTQTVAALKMVAGAVIDLRGIVALIGKILIWLRDIVVQ